MPPPLHPPNHYYDSNKAGWEEERRKMHNNPPSSLYQSSVSSYPHQTTNTYNSSQYGHPHPNHHLSPQVHHNDYSNHFPQPVSYLGSHSSQHNYNGNYHQENIRPTSYSNGWTPLPPTYGNSNGNPPPSKHYTGHLDSHGFDDEKMNGRGNGGRRGERRERREGFINDQTVWKNSQFEEWSTPRKRFNSKGDSYSSSNDSGLHRLILHSGGLTEAEKKEFTALIQDLWGNQRFAQEFKKYNVGEYLRVRDLLEKVKEKEEEEKDKMKRGTTRQ